MSEKHFVHGIYFVNPIFIDDKKHRIINRKHFYECHDKKIPYQEDMKIPQAFINTLYCKWKKWEHKLKEGLLEFTYAYNNEYAVLVMAGPEVQFIRKEGYKWAKRRLKKAEIIYKNINEQLKNKYVPESRKSFLRKNVKVVKLNDE